VQAEALVVCGDKNSFGEISKASITFIITNTITITITIIIIITTTTITISTTITTSTIIILPANRAQLLPQHCR
jgi:hypothetical protein